MSARQGDQDGARKRFPVSLWVALAVPLRARAPHEVRPLDLTEDLVRLGPRGQGLALLALVQQAQAGLRENVDVPRAGVAHAHVPRKIRKDVE